MNAPEKESFIREVASSFRAEADDRIMWSGHAIVRLAALPWDRSRVEQSLATCKVIEDYRNGHRGLPDCLVLGMVDEAEPFHAVVALDVPRFCIVLVTIYRPETERWEDGWYKRKKR